MLFLFADITILLVSLPAAKTGVGVAATAGIATDTSCAITLPPGPLPCRDYNTNDNIEVDKRCTLQLHLNFLEHFPCNFTITENTLLILTTVNKMNSSAVEQKELMQTYS